MNYFDVKSDYIITKTSSIVYFKMALLYLDGWIKELEVAVGNDKSTVSKSTSSNDKSNKPNEKVVKEKKEKVPVPPPVPAVSAELSINSLDLRVGLITSCVKHETADKLYCEEIDIGEVERRPIASGLVKHYSLDQMQNRKVIVIANLGKN